MAPIKHFGSDNIIFVVFYPTNKKYLHQLCFFPFEIVFYILLFPLSVQPFYTLDIFILVELHVALCWRGHIKIPTEPLQIYDKSVRTSNKNYERFEYIVFENWNFNLIQRLIATNAISHQPMCKAMAQLFGINCRRWKNINHPPRTMWSLYFFESLKWHICLFSLKIFFRVCTQNSLIHEYEIDVQSILPLKTHTRLKIIFCQYGTCFVP